MPYVSGIQTSNLGAVYSIITPAAVQSAQFVGANALSQEGEWWMQDLASAAVPATAVFNGGYAYRPDGALYVTTAAPSATSVMVQGIATRADGAVHITTAIPTTPRYAAGKAVTDTGILYVTSLPIQLGATAAYRYGLGITSATALVSQWDDLSGNSNHLTQGTDTNKPTLDTDNSLLFDGADNYMQAVFTFAQPMTLYALCKQVTWTSADPIISGAAGATRGITQRGTTPNVGLNYGTGVITVSFTLDTWGVLAGVINGAGSSLQLNLGTPGTGNPGANSMDGITLAGNAGTPTTFGNIAFKEVIAYSAAHDAETRARVIRYLMHVGGI